MNRGPGWTGPCVFMKEISILLPPAQCWEMIEIQIDLHAIVHWNQFSIERIENIILIDTIFSVTVNGAISVVVLLYHQLSHWSPGYAARMLRSNFQSHIKDRYLEHFLWNYHPVDAIKPHWLLVNIASDDSLVLSGNKPLPEPMLTQTCVTLWHHQATLIL